MVKIIIYGRLDGLNKYVNDNRNNRYKGSKNKRDNEKVVFKAIQALKDVEACVYPISIRTTWYEPDKRRDGDNIVFAKKYILDTLVKRGIIKGDGQRYINSFVDIIKTDTENPRIEIELHDGNIIEKVCEIYDIGL